MKAVTEEFSLQLKKKYPTLCSNNKMADISMIISENKLYKLLANFDQLAFLSSDKIAYRIDGSVVFDKNAFVIGNKNDTVCNIVSESVKFDVRVKGNACSWLLFNVTTRSEFMNEDYSVDNKLAGRILSQLCRLVLREPYLPLKKTYFFEQSDQDLALFAIPVKSNFESEEKFEMVDANKNPRANDVSVVVNTDSAGQGTFNVTQLRKLEPNSTYYGTLALIKFS